MTTREANEIILRIIEERNIRPIEEAPIAIRETEALQKAKQALEELEELTNKEFTLGDDANLIIKPIERESDHFYADNEIVSSIVITEAGLKFLLDTSEGNTRIVRITLNKRQTKQIGKALKKLSKSLTKVQKGECK